MNEKKLRNLFNITVIFDSKTRWKWKSFNLPKKRLNNMREKWERKNFLFFITIFHNNWFFCIKITFKKGDPYVDPER